MFDSFVEWSLFIVPNQFPCVCMIHDILRSDKMLSVLFFFTSSYFIFFFIFYFPFISFSSLHKNYKRLRENPVRAALLLWISNRL